MLSQLYTLPSLRLRSDRSGRCVCGHRVQSVRGSGVRYAGSIGCPCYFGAFRAGRKSDIIGEIEIRFCSKNGNAV